MMTVLWKTKVNVRLRKYSCVLFTVFICQWLNGKYSAECFLVWFVYIESPGKIQLNALCIFHRCFRNNSAVTISTATTANSRLYIAWFNLLSSSHRAIFSRVFTVYFGYWFNTLICIYFEIKMEVGQLTAEFLQVWLGCVDPPGEKMFVPDIISTWCCRRHTLSLRYMLEKLRFNCGTHMDSVWNI